MMPGKKKHNTTLAQRLFGRRPPRKYPISRDKYGRSLRRRAFDLFGEGRRPAEVAEVLAAKPATIYRYHADWKKQSSFGSYADRRRRMKLDPKFTELVVSTIMDTLEMTRDEVITELQKPWGLMGYLKGRWPNPKLRISQHEIQARLEGALIVMRLAESLGNDLETVNKELMDLLTCTRQERDDRRETQDQ